MELNNLKLTSKLENQVKNLEDKDLSSFNIPIKSLSTELRVYLTPYQMKRLKQIEKDLNLSTKEVIIELLDLYYLNSAKDLSSFIKRLTIRIEKGINLSFITQLKIIYTFIGHFLKKTKYL